MFKKKIPAIFLLTSLLFSSAQSVFGAVDVTPTELQTASSIVIPNSDGFGALEGYSSFFYKEKASITGGLTARYSARLLSDPWLSTELPQIQILMMSYADQNSATSAFEQMLESEDFEDQRKTLLSSSKHTFFYTSEEEGNYSDFFKSVNSEYRSFHYVERNGNVLFQASLFREDGEYHQDNVEAYRSATEGEDSIKTLLSSALDDALLSVGLLFPPTDPFFTSQSESSSVDLSEFYTLPTHGSLSVDVYVSDAGASSGTVLDSSGVGSAEAGDLYLYINDEGRLLAGIYAPSFDADCPQESGWYRIESSSILYPYEWNSLRLDFGVGGFGLWVNGVEEAHCSVSQPRSSRTVYLGDFPSDSLSESMIGFADHINAEYSLTDSGKRWDEVLEEQLFLDLPNTDPDLGVFEFLKEEGVFTGSDGMLYPDAVLNRAEMVKILLKAFNIGYSTKTTQPFWDLEEDAWYKKYVTKAYEVGMVEGYADGSFLPAQKIVRAEFFTMLARLDEYDNNVDAPYADVESEDWFSDAASYAWTKKLVRTSLFYPWNEITRREAAQALYSLLK